MKKGYKTDRKNTIQGYNKNARCEKSRRPIKNISLKHKEGPCKQRNQLCNRDEKGVPPAVSVLPNPLYVFSRDIFQEKIYYPGINGWFPEYPKQTPKKSFLGEPCGNGQGWGQWEACCIYERKFQTQCMKDIKFYNEKLLQQFKNRSRMKLLMIELNTNGL